MMRGVFMNLCIANTELQDKNNTSIVVGDNNKPSEVDSSNIKIPFDYWVRDMYFLYEGKTITFKTFNSTSIKLTNIINYMDFFDILLKGYDQKVFQSLASGVRTLMFLSSKEYACFTRRQKLFTKLVLLSGLKTATDVGLYVLRNKQNYGLRDVHILVNGTNSVAKDFYIRTALCFHYLSRTKIEPLEEKFSAQAGYEDTQDFADQQRNVISDIPFKIMGMGMPILHQSVGEIDMLFEKTLDKERYFVVVELKKSKACQSKGRKQIDRYIQVLATLQPRAHIMGLLVCGSTWNNIIFHSPQSENWQKVIPSANSSYKRFRECLLSSLGLDEDQVTTPEDTFYSVQAGQEVLDILDEAIAFCSVEQSVSSFDIDQSSSWANVSNLTNQIRYRRRIRLLAMFPLMDRSRNSLSYMPPTFIPDDESLRLRALLLPHEVRQNNNRFIPQSGLEQNLEDTQDLNKESAQTNNKFETTIWLGASKRNIRVVEPNASSLTLEPSLLYRVVAYYNDKIIALGSEVTALTKLAHLFIMSPFHTITAFLNHIFVSGGSTYFTENLPWLLIEVLQPKDVINSVLEPSAEDTDELSVVKSGAWGYYFNTSTAWDSLNWSTSTKISSIMVEHRLALAQNDSSKISKVFQWYKDSLEDSDQFKFSIQSGPPLGGSELNTILFSNKNSVTDSQIKSNILLVVVRKYLLLKELLARDDKSSISAADFSYLFYDDDESKLSDRGEVKSYYMEIVVAISSFIILLPLAIGYYVGDSALPIGLAASGHLCSITIPYVWLCVIGNLMTMCPSFDGDHNKRF